MLRAPRETPVYSQPVVSVWSACMRAKKKSVRRRKRVDWSAADVKALKGHAGKKSASQIGKVLKRSVAAVRFKAHMLKVSLATR